MLDAPVNSVWELVADPYHLPRWWPRCVRVEDVRDSGRGDRRRWTKVLETDRGRIVRADYRCRSELEPHSVVWEQQVDGTPFERIVGEATLSVELKPEDGSTRMTLISRQRLRGLSKLGGVMMRRGTSRNLDEALAGAQQALEAER